MNDYFAKFEKISLQFFNDTLDVLSEPQKRRIVQVRRQLSQSHGLPFRYYRNHTFRASADLDKTQEQEFLQYLKQTAGLDFNRRINTLVQKHRTRVLDALSAKTRKSLLDLIGTQRPVRLIASMRKEGMFRHACYYRLDDRLMENEMDEFRFDAWSKLLVNHFVVSDLEWLDNQHQQHMEILREHHYFRARIRGPEAKKRKVGKQWMMSVDPDEMKAYESKRTATFQKYHKQRMQLLVDHQKDRLLKSLRQCRNTKRSVLAYLGEERFLQAANATASEKTALRKALKQEEHELNLKIQKMVSRQNDDVFRQLPENRREALRAIFGEPLECDAVPELVLYSYFRGYPKYKDLQKAQNGGWRPRRR